LRKPNQLFTHACAMTYFYFLSKHALIFKSLLTDWRRGDLCC